MPSHGDEVARARILAKYDILDSGAERAFDDLTSLASTLCDAPASIITFIDGDRLYFKSAHGLTATEAPVEHSFCAHAAGAPREVFTVGNALEDGRFLQNAFVMPADGLRAYAGANIVNEEGVALGSICVVDFEPRDFTAAQRESLQRLSNLVTDQLEHRRRIRELERRERLLEETNAHFERFSYAVSHDLRGPLNNQAYLLEALLEDYGDFDFPEGIGRYFEMLAANSARGHEMLDRLTEFLRRSVARGAKPERVDLAALYGDVSADLPIKERHRVRFDAGDFDAVRTHPVALRHILLNLVQNAVKYTDAADGDIRVETGAEGAELTICVIDAGPGIPAAEQDSIFDVFLRGRSTTEDGGSGMGLAVAQRLANSIGGRILLNSPEGGGCTFEVRLPL